MWSKQYDRMDGCTERWRELRKNESLYVPEKRYRERARADSGSHKSGLAAFTVDDSLEPAWVRTAARQPACNPDCRYIVICRAVLFAIIGECLQAARIAPGRGGDSGSTENCQSI